MVDLKKKTPLSDLIWRGMKVNLWSLAWPLHGLKRLLCPAARSETRDVDLWQV